MPSHLDFHEQLIALVNKYNDAELLYKLLDPRGEFLGPSVTAKVLASKLSRPEHRFTDVEQIRQAIANDQLFDTIIHSLEQTPWMSHPMLLLPLRLETRFKDSKLIVRIYPDQVFVNTHEEALTEAEYQAVKGLCAAPDDEKRAAWRLLSSQFGPPRAAWLKNWPENHDVAVAPRFRSASWTQAPGLMCLPDVFWVFAYRREAGSLSLVDMKSSRPVRADSTILALPSSTVPLRLSGEPGTQIKAGTQVKHNPSGSVWMIAETATIGADRKIDVSAKSGFLTAATRTTDWSMERGIAGWESVESLTDSASEGLFDDRSKWMHDLPTAIQDGFAVEFTGLSQEDLTQGFDRLVAVGVKWTNPSGGKDLVEGMLDNHHYTGGIGFVAPGTPTNNTAEVKSPFSSREDHDRAYEIEYEGPSNWEAWKEQPREERRTNAHRLAHALGIDPERLRYVEGAGSIGDSYADAMNTLIWQVTGDYYLRHLSPVPHDEGLEGLIEHLETHICEFVRGGGPLPTLRIKRQPYGVLPVCRLQGAQSGEGSWTPWEDDPHSSPVWDRALYRLVIKFHLRWLEYTDVSCSWCIPRVGNVDADPDETLLSILSMQPHSIGYHARPFVDQEFVDFFVERLRDYAFRSESAYEDSGFMPLQWISRWSRAWEPVHEYTARLLAGLTSTDARGVNGEPRPQLSGWWASKGGSVGMVHDPDDKSIRPITYLAELCTSSATEAHTLLADMARRALFLAKQEPQDSSKSDRVQSALCQLSGNSVLGFFNAVEDPEEIVQRIKDDPKRRVFADVKAPRAYGVRRDLARRILQRRAELGGRFQSLGEIDGIRGVGPDTFHDIVFSFRDDEGQPDLDRLFRESLDLVSHRVDAWVTSFAKKRLDGIRAKDSSKTGIHLGAYGVVEDLVPRHEKVSEGYIHAPSADQAATAAVLYNAFLTHDPEETRDDDEDDRTENPYHFNLTSDRVRKAMNILEGIRQGQALGAVLGYQFERALQDHDQPLEQYIDDFRDRFPVVAHKVTPATDGAPEAAEVVAARNVVDGAALAREAREEENKDQFVETLFRDTTPPAENHITALAQVITTLEDTLDAVGDLLITESTYQATRGNHERAGAALEASHGNLTPPELEFVTTPVPGRMLSHRVCLLFNDTLELDPNGDGDFPSNPRDAAEPRVARWIDSVLGNRGQIHIGFAFWEEEVASNVRGLVNVNTASRRDLARLRFIGERLAHRIVEERCGERGPFRQIADLQRVQGIGTWTVQALRPRVTTGYVERINVNTASRQQLKTLPIPPQIAERIEEARDRERFARIGDLARVVGIGDATVAELRPYVTTGLEEIGLDELGLSTTDFLYAAQASPEGGETEIEQRVGRIVRDEFSLPAAQRIEVLPSESRHGEYSLENAVELAQQVLKLLATGQPMSPDGLCHSGDIKEEGYRDTDAEALERRVENACKWVSRLLADMDALKEISQVGLSIRGAAGTRIASGTRVRHVPTGTVWEIADEATIGADGAVDVVAGTIEAGPPIVVAGASDWAVETAADTFSARPIAHPVAGGRARRDSVQSIGHSTVRGYGNIVDLLEKAAEFGVHGAYPPARDDPQLLQRFENTRAELGRRKVACERLLVKAKSINNPNGRVRQLVRAMKALFGKSFICLPTFAPHNPEDLKQAWAEDVDILNGLGPERLRLWMQQAAEVRPPIKELEDTLILIEGWSQTTLTGEAPSLELKVVQLPFTEDRNWLGLSIEEGAEREPKPGWTQSPLSLVAAVNGAMPGFIQATDGAEDKDLSVTAGLILDQWSELIPAKRLNTSVAFQYDAPNTQPPQALLLAVPGRMKEVPDIWAPQELAAIVNDTLDLAKVRTVDPEALAADPNRPVGLQPELISGIVPGIYLPTDPEHPSWARDIVDRSYREWIDALEEAPHQCVRGYLDWPRLTGDSGQEWTLIPHRDFDVSRFAPGLDFRSPDDTYLLDGAYVEVKGHVASEKHRVFYRDYRVESYRYPASFTSFVYTGTASLFNLGGQMFVFFEHGGSRHLILGRLAIEVGRLPHSVTIKTSLAALDAAPELECDVRTKIWGFKPPDKNVLWVDGYSAKADGEKPVYPSDSNLDYKFTLKVKNAPISVGEVEKRGEDTVGLSGLISQGEYFEGIYDEDRMQSYIGSKIWVARDIRTPWYHPIPVSSLDPVVEFDLNFGEPHEYSVFYVSDFGLIREKDAIFGCEGYRR